MISYAQNFEDVILARVFNDKPQGFYIDAGAAHPFFHSVTAHFYEKGWRGINVEPLPVFFAELESARTEDVNLNVALGDNTGTQIIYEIKNNIGMSTLSASLIRQYIADSMGFDVIERVV